MKSALCGIVRNEQSSVLQWLNYHLLLGFETILLIDDHSTDETIPLARHAAATNDIRLLTLTETGITRQSQAYARICADHAAEFSWIGFLDLDEYLVPHSTQTLPELLQAGTDQAGIVFPWLIFGSSGHVDSPGGLVIQEYRQRADIGFGPNRHVKSIIRPGALMHGVNPHYFEMNGPQRLCDGQDPDWDQPGVLRTMPPDSPWYVHHYFTRSRSDWTRRLARGQLGQWTRTWDDFAAYDRNDVQDDTALQAVPALRARLDGSHTAAISQAA